MKDWIKNFAYDTKDYHFLEFVSASFLSGDCQFCDYGKGVFFSGCLVGAWWGAHGIKAAFGAGIALMLIFIAFRVWVRTFEPNK